MKDVKMDKCLLLKIDKEKKIVHWTMEMAANYINMEKLLQYGDNVKKYCNQGHTTVVNTNSSGQFTLTQSYWENIILQARIQHSRLQKHFHHSSTHMGKMKNWKYGRKKWEKWKYLYDLYDLYEFLDQNSVNVC